MKIKKVLSIILCFILLLNILSACSAEKERVNNNKGSGRTERNNDSEDTTQNQQNLNFHTSVTIEDSTDFSGGFAWMKCIDGNGESYLALVNSNKQTIYSTKYSRESLLADFGKTVGYYADCDSNGNDIYKIVNSQGEIVASSESKEFDIVLACGDENVFVYKNASDYAGQKHLYGFFDSQGKWITDPFELQNDFSSYNHKAAYVNCGMYRIGDTQNAVLINSDNGSATYLKNFWHFNWPVFNDDAAVITADDLRSMEINGTSEYGIIVLKKDGTYTVYSDIDKNYSDIYNNIFIKSHADYNDSETVIIQNFINDVIISKKDYLNCTNIRSTYFQDGKAMITFTGADGYNYFTVIDELGNETLPPTQAQEAAFSENIVVYAFTDENTNELSVRAIDITGNVLFENKAYITSVFEFHNGIGRVNNNTFVDTNGNKILESINV